MPVDEKNVKPVMVQGDLFKSPLVIPIFPPIIEDIGTSVGKVRVSKKEVRASHNEHLKMQQNKGCGRYTLIVLEEEHKDQ